MVKSAYIHIPFCKSKCHYCSFVSFVNDKMKTEYLKALLSEIKEYYNSETLNTIYFGGGTPSILNPVEIEKILKQFNFSEKTEVTVELNPDDVNYDYLRQLNDFGVNRISLGCQTFDDNILKMINRRHNSSQVIEAISLAQKAGFKNISIDLIYGLPTQNEDLFYLDLRRAVNLGIKHISLYGLTIEKGCYFYEHGYPSPEEDMMADMYLGAIELLTKTGFEHYEISNFSIAGYNSRHNLNYWNNEEYYGFGVAAHGYQNRVRYANKTNLEDYISDPLSRADEKLLTQREILEEEIFLGFRKISGININEINKKFDIDFEEKYNEILKKYEGFNLMTKTNSGYALTSEGVLVSNTILADFIE